MVDNKAPEVKVPFCIYEGYILKGLSELKIDQTRGMQMILTSLQLIEKYRGVDKVIDVVAKYELEKVGITLKK